jgi:hypothetical protein
VPNRPKTSSLSSVASLESLITESRLSPLSGEGFSKMSFSSFHLICVEMKASVTSVSPLASTKAGLFLLPDKPVKGNGISTISPLVIGISL